MKAFIIWLLTQAIFARVLIGMVIATIVQLKVPFEWYLSVLFPATAICIVEAIVSAIVVYPLINPRIYTNTNKSGY